MLKSESGATMETELEETPSGWVARYLIVSRDLVGYQAAAAGLCEQG